MRVFKLIAIISLVACLALSVGCGRKKNYSADDSSNQSSNVGVIGDATVDETLPETEVDKENSDGSQVKGEDKISAGILNDPEEYNKKQEEANNATSKEQNSSTSSKEQNSSVSSKDESSSAVQKPSNDKNDSQINESVKENDSKFSTGWR